MKNLIKSIIVLFVLSFWSTTIAAFTRSGPLKISYITIDSSKADSDSNFRFVDSLFNYIHNNSLDAMDLIVALKAGNYIIDLKPYQLDSGGGNLLTSLTFKSLNGGMVNVEMTLNNGNLVYYLKDLNLKKLSISPPIHTNSWLTLTNCVITGRLEANSDKFSEIQFDALNCSLDSISFFAEKDAILDAGFKSCSLNYFNFKVMESLSSSGGSAGFSNSSVAGDISCSGYPVVYITNSLIKGKVYLGSFCSLHLEHSKVEDIVGSEDTGYSNQHEPIVIELSRSTVNSVSLFDTLNSSSYYSLQRTFSTNSSVVNSINIHDYSKTELYFSTLNSIRIGRYKNVLYKPNISMYGSIIRGNINLEDYYGNAKNSDSFFNKTNDYNNFISPFLCTRSFGNSGSVSVDTIKSLSDWKSKYKTEQNSSTLNPQFVNNTSDFHVYEHMLNRVPNNITYKPRFSKYDLDSFTRADTCTAGAYEVYSYHPIAKFTYHSSCFGDTVQFENLSKSSISSWYWDFGDGASSTLTEPKHYFSSAGIKSITLIVANSKGISDTIIKTISIFQLPTANFTRSGDTLIATLASTYQWSLNGTKLTGQTNQKLVATSNGTYGLEVTNANGCIASYSASVRIYDTISGIISQYNGNPLKNSRTYLCEYNPKDTTIKALDSVKTDSLGSYMFLTKLKIVYLNVFPDTSLYPNEKAVWADSGKVFGAATKINLHGDTVINFSTIKGTNPGGSGFIGGRITQCNLCKKLGPGMPIPNLRVLLIDAKGNEVDDTYTDANGYFSFSKLAAASYKVWVDYPLVDNSKAPLVDLTSTTKKDSLNFTLYYDRLELIVESGILNFNKENYSLTAYPNPFTQTTTIHFSLPKSETITLGLYDLNGQELTLISNQKYAEGNHQFELNDVDSKLANGIYLLKLITGNGMVSKRLVRIE